MPIPARACGGPSTTPATAPAVEIAGERPLQSGDYIDEPALRKRQCLAGHQARSGHSCQPASRATGLQLSAGGGLPSYGVSRLRPTARSLPSNASTASSQVPSPGHSGGGLAPADARAGTRPLTTTTTTRTCPAATTTSEASWKGRYVLSSPTPSGSCENNSSLSMTGSSPARSTTRSHRSSAPGGCDASTSDALGDSHHIKDHGMQHQRQRTWQTSRRAPRCSIPSRTFGALPPPAVGVAVAVPPG